MQVQVSVIVAVYNEARWIHRCLTSLRQQTLVGLEVIVVDDGSTDGTAAICDQYAQQWPQTFRVIHQSNRGQGPARNAGIAAAQGRYLGFVDGDDWVEPTMYATLLATAERSQAQIVVCDVRKLYVATNRETSLLSLPAASDHVDIAAYLKYGLNNAYSGNKLYARDCWTNCRYQPMVYEDLDILLDMLSRCERLAYVQQPFYNYYKHAGSTTLDYTNPRLFDIMTAYRDAVAHAAPRYADAVTYCVAKRILINLTTPGFIDYLAPFTELIRGLATAFKAGPSVMNDPAIKRILYYATQPTLPPYLICTVQNWLDSWQTYSRGLTVMMPKTGQTPVQIKVRPDAVKRDYWQLQSLFDHGGLLVLGPVTLQRPFGQLRAGGDVVVYRGERCLVLGAQPQSPLVFELCQRLLSGLQSLSQLLTSIKTQPQQWALVTNNLRRVAVTHWVH